MLSLFSKDGLSTAPHQSDLVAKVLAQQDVTMDKDGSSNLKDYTAKIKRVLGTNDSVGKVMAEVLAEKMLLNNINIDSLFNVVDKLTSLPTTPVETALFIFNNLNAYIDDTHESASHEDAFIQGLLAHIKKPTSDDAVKAEIEKDMINLIALFKDCVAKAINLELPFVSTITHFIDTLRTNIKGDAYREFISQNIGDICHQQFQHFDDQKSKSEIQLNIISEMNSIIHKMEMGA